MKAGLFHLIARAFRNEPRLHPIEQRMAKHWVKQRLLAVFPELRGNPKALEQAYQSLSLEPGEGTEEGDSDTVFTMNAPHVD